jgi:hypothetical protein
LSRKRSKDALTAATNTYLKPFLIESGFHHISIRRFAKVRNEVLHFIGLQLSAYGSRDFCVNYASQSLLVPNDVIDIGFGDRLRMQRSETWWPSKSHEEADVAMQDVVVLIKKQAITHFDETRSTKDYLKVITSRKNRRKSYYVMYRACCSARVGKKKLARKSAQESIKLCQSVNPDYWGSHIGHRIQVMQNLLAAIDKGNEQDLLDEWMDQTIRALDLGGIIPQ